MLAACAAERPARIGELRTETDRVESEATGAFEWSVPNCTHATTYVRIPAGTLDGLPLDSFYLATCEVTWDELEAWMTDEQLADDVDAVSRPSRPYISIDRGFGRGDHPALSLSGRSAQGFAEWLGERTGHAFRLPTHRELRYAALAGRPPRTLPLAEEAWFAQNSDGRTQPVGRSCANPFGVHDLYGNVAEWCRDANGELGLFGGSYRDDSDQLVEAPLQRPSAAWNRSDPQLPKSVWWYADASFPGLRLAADVAP